MTDLALASLSALWLWYVLAHLRPPLIGPLLDILRNTGAREFLLCPWCAGAWIALATTLATVATFDPATLLVTWLASAAVVGIAGTYLPGSE